MQLAADAAVAPSDYCAGAVLRTLHKPMLHSSWFDLSETKIASLFRTCGGGVRFGQADAEPKGLLAALRYVFADCRVVSSKTGDRESSWRRQSLHFTVVAKVRTEATTKIAPEGRVRNWS